MASTLVGQPGAYGANGQIQYPYAAQQFATGAVNPLLQSQLQTPFQPHSSFGGYSSYNPYNSNPYNSSPGALGMQGLPQAAQAAQQGVQILAQLAHQILTHGALTQQTGIAIQQAAQQLAQLVQQLAMQGLLLQQGFGSAQQAAAAGLQQGAAGSQPLQSPYLNPLQSVYAGFGGAGPFGSQPGFGQPTGFSTAGQGWSQGWNAGRPTIQ